MARDRRCGGSQREILCGVISRIGSEQGDQVAEAFDEDVAGIQRRARNRKSEAKVHRPYQRRNSAALGQTYATRSGFPRKLSSCTYFYCGGRSTGPRLIDTRPLRHRTARRFV
jgi:hypothetical protein